MATGSGTTTITVQPASEKPGVRIVTSLNYEANKVSPGNAHCADYFDQIN